MMLWLVRMAGNTRKTLQNRETAPYNSRTISPSTLETSKNIGLTVNFDGGGGGIRTHETLSGLTVFKTAGVNRFPTPPSTIGCSIVTYAAFGDNPCAERRAPRCERDIRQLRRECRVHACCKNDKI